MSQGDKLEITSVRARLLIEVERESDGAWVARVPLLRAGRFESAATAPTREGAIKAACALVSASGSMSVAVSPW